MSVEWVDGKEAFLSRSEFPHLDRWIPYLSAYAPVDVENIGGMCRVVLETNYEFYIAMSVVAVHRTIIRHTGGLGGLRQHWTNATSRSQSVPVPVVARDLTLMPLKLRSKPQGKNDGTIGYVADRMIAKAYSLPDSPNQTHILLMTGHELVADVSYNGFVNAFGQMKAFICYLQNKGILPYSFGHNTAIFPGGPLGGANANSGMGQEDVNNPVRPSPKFWPTYEHQGMTSGTTKPLGSNHTEGPFPPSLPPLCIPPSPASPEVPPPLSGASGAPRPRKRS